MSDLPHLSTAPRVARHSSRWLALTLIFVALRALPNLSYPLSRDQATYSVIGRALLHGAGLYRDVWDMKPPAIFWVYAVVVKLFGPVMWSAGLVDILWLLAISYCIFRFAERSIGTAAAAVAVAVNASWHCRMGYVNAAQPENFLLLLVFVAWFQVRPHGRWTLARHFAAGALLGAAFWFKYNAIAYLPLLTLVPYLDLAGLDAQPRRRALTVPWGVWLRRMGAVGAGFGLTVAGVLGYFARTGLWSALWNSHFAVASRYGVSPLGHAGDYFMTTLAGTVLFLGPLTALAPLAALAVARHNGHETREMGKLAPVAAGAALGALSVAMQFHVHRYSFEVCYAFFAMTWGYLAVKAFEKVRELWRRTAVAPVKAEGDQRPPLIERRYRSLTEKVLLGTVLASAVLLPATLESWSIARRYRELADCVRHPDAFYAGYPEQHPLEHLDGELRVVRFLKQAARPGDEVYVWGAAALIYDLAGLGSPSRFVPNFPLMTTWGPPAWRDELLGDLRRSPPAYLVVARNDQAPTITFTDLDSERYLQVFPALRAFIDDSYQPAATYPDFIVYRRIRPP